MQRLPPSHVDGGSLIAYVLRILEQETGGCAKTGYGVDAKVLMTTGSMIRYGPCGWQLWH